MGRVESTIRHWPNLTLAFVALLTVVVVSGPLPARAAISQGAYESCLLDATNEARAAQGVGELRMASELVGEVRDWSEWMRFNEFEHMPESRRQQILPDSATTWGENIARYGFADMPDCMAMHEMWMDSPPHRANLLSQNYSYVVIGTYVDESGWWATQLFFDAPDGQSASCAGTFCDDDGSVFEDSIELIAQAGITNGCNPPAGNLYCPDARVSRGAMAAFLARALNLPDGTATDYVDDDDSVFEDAIERIASAGITQGCNPPSNTRFCPDEYVTRGQMAAFLARALGLPAGSVDFVDDDDSVFEDAIERIASAGITQGCNPPSNTRFCPDEYVTRGQMAAFLARALDL